ncbi:unnamed protein product, partial [Coregonus sp. 'balchen']
GTLTWLYLASGDPYVTETLVRQAEVVAQPRVYTVECSEDYENYKRYPGCTPQTCGRAVTDNSVPREEAMALRRLAEMGLALAGSDGGASILDLHSGALSMGKQFRRHLTWTRLFSRINSTLAKTQHDEYWLPHKDKRYRNLQRSFDYTCLTTEPTSPEGGSSSWTPMATALWNHAQ